MAKVMTLSKGSEVFVKIDDLLVAILSQASMDQSISIKSLVDSLTALKEGALE